MTSGKGGWIKRKLTVQTTATYTVLPDDYFLFANAAVTTTYTLPVMEIGRELWFRTAQSAMVAASANVIALAGTPTGTAILPATPGKWALLVNIGDYVGVDLWAICAGN
jgi:endonuclease/exonuclease/phosphatase (EEP) superfamily protein YafD